jgi:hypothetical protein
MEFLATLIILEVIFYILLFYCFCVVPIKLCIAKARSRSEVEDPVRSVPIFPEFCGVHSSVRLLY